MCTYITGTLPLPSFLSPSLLPSPSPIPPERKKGEIGRWTEHGEHGVIDSYHGDSYHSARKLFYLSDTEVLCSASTLSRLPSTPANNNTWFESFYVPRCQHDDDYIDGRSQIWASLGGHLSALQLLNVSFKHFYSNQRIFKTGYVMRLLVGGALNRIML